MYMYEYDSMVHYVKTSPFIIIVLTFTFFSRSYYQKLSKYFSFMSYKKKSTTSGGWFLPISGRCRIFLLKHSFINFRLNDFALSVSKTNSQTNRRTDGWIAGQTQMDSREDKRTPGEKYLIRISKSLIRAHL